MPFYVYRVRNPGPQERGPHASGDAEYQQVREIGLSGKKGPFRRICDEVGGREWHSTDARILSLRQVEPPDEHRILIDLKPKDQKNVSLYRLRDVWGYSYDNWTPIALRLETLFADEPQKSPSKFKQKFVSPLETKDLIYEFLYLQGGTEGGHWTWGLVGRVNGALLWPDALGYFIKSINRQRIDENLEPF